VLDSYKGHGMKQLITDNSYRKFMEKCKWKIISNGSEVGKDIWGSVRKYGLVKLLQVVAVYNVKNIKAWNDESVLVAERHMTEMEVQLELQNRGVSRRQVSRSV